MSTRERIRVKNLNDVIAFKLSLQELEHLDRDPHRVRHRAFPTIHRSGSYRLHFLAIGQGEHNDDVLRLNDFGMMIGRDGVGIDAINAAVRG